MRKAAAIAGALSTAGQRLAAAQAWAVVAVVDPALALEGLRSLDLPGDEAPLEFRLTELEIRALNRLADSDRPGALTAIDMAMELGRRHQLSLAASDVRER